MENCLNNNFEGKIIEIPGMENNPDEYFFKYKSNCKGYIIGINLNYNNTGIIISIDSKYKNKKIPIRKLFTYEEIEKYDPEFFKPFKGNIFTLFNFISRLLLANLVNLETKIEGNKNLYFLILNCLKDCELRPIAIDLNNDDVETINLDRTSVFKNNNKKIKLNNKTNANKDYKIELRKIEHEYENSEIYKEIEIKFTNIKENRVYFDYLNSQDIFNRNIPYYELFNGSMDDVFDDLNIIIFHKNYYFEECTASIKLFFYVFNIRKNGTDPYISNFIEALNREREYNEFQSKMEEYFESKLKMKQYSEKNENIDEQNNEKSKKENKRIKKGIENNSKMSYWNNFLNMNKNLKTNNDENKNNNEIKNENNEQKKLKQSNNKYNNIEKKELIEQIFIKKESNINNNKNNILNSNLLEKNHETSKDDSSYINQKRYKESTLDMYFGKRKKIEENILSENKEIILNNKDNTKNLNNYSLENKEKSIKEKKVKKKDKKLYIDKPKKEGNKKSREINMNFKLNKNNRYNINKNKVINSYLNLLYVHPLDNDNEIEIIEKKGGGIFYLCKICKIFFNSKISVREHQWKEHLKPFGRKIQNDLKSKNKIK